MGQARRKAIALGVDPDERRRLIAENNQRQLDALQLCRRATPETIDAALIAWLAVRRDGYRLSIGRGPK